VSIDDLIEQAQNKYPKKAGKIEEHHIEPKYMGGDPKGTTVPLDGAYHQEITNEFRDLYPYGSGPTTPKQMKEILDQVYGKFPLPE
jgi:hypothetical protein